MYLYGIWSGCTKNKIDFCCILLKRIISSISTHYTTRFSSCNYIKCAGDILLYHLLSLILIYKQTYPSFCNYTNEIIM